MKIKLHKIDMPSSSEDDIVMGPGKHVIGRGNLKDQDRRVSREHMEIEILSCGSVFVTALHDNPIFFRLADSEGGDMTTALAKGERRATNDGDCISLLPGCLSFKIEYLTDNGSFKSIENSSSDTILPSDNSADKTSSKKADSEKNRLSQNGEPSDPARTPDSVDTEAANDSDLLIIEQSLGSPYIIEDDDDDKLPSEQIDRNDRLIVGDGSAVTVKREADSNEGEPSAKRQRSDSEVDKTKENIKTEPTDAAVVKAEETVKEEEAGGSGNGGGDPSAEAPARPGCMYGAACYRKNPIHRADFSHPSDADWKNPPDCPWGAACYRQSRHHRAKYNHVGPPAPRPPGVAKKKQPKKKPAAATPVPGSCSPIGKRKRTTKAKKHRPSWSESGSDNEYDLEDPFMTDDSSDDYQPSTSSYTSEDSD